MFGPLPATRPPGLRRRRLLAETRLWRIDRSPPSAWSWQPFAEPRHRFDSAAGAFRTRYAASSVHGAARERYLATGRLIPADHADHHLVEVRITRAFQVLDLRTERNLDVLDFDDRISTGHEPAVRAAGRDLADRVHTWWDDLDGLVYRSRTTPSTSMNVAFFSAAGLALTSRPLHACGAELDDLVLHHQFTLDFDR
ncbi:MAG: hypothetical protein JWN46_3651 [Acidimicrobiales bacterium]|nr:hypothetical protein [Acidimicrobiales bacterium]